MPEGRPARGAAVAAAGDERAPVRAPVAVLLSRFPVITETFILREVVEMERQGQPVRLVPLLRERPAVVHPEALPWIGRALYTPFLSPAIAASNLRALRRRPRAVLRLLARLALGRGLGWSFRVRSLALFPKAVHLAERLPQEGIRHLHAHFATHPTTVAWIAASLADLTYSVTIHAHDLFVRRDLLAEKLGAASWVRLISEFNRRTLRSFLPDLPANRLHVVHVGVEAAPEPADAPAPDTSAGLLCIAALKPYKGIPVLLEACRLLLDRGVELVCDVVGEGPLRRRLEERIRSLDLAGRVRLLGARTQAEVAELIGGATLVVLPSVVASDGQMEGIPVALMEAMAAGKPVVASSLSGVPELIEDGREGRLVPPGDAAALADALEEVLASPQRRRAMGARGREKVAAAFRLDRCVGELLALLDAGAPPPDPELAAALDRLGLLDAGAAAPVPEVAPALGGLGPRAGGGSVGVRPLVAGKDSRVVELLLPHERVPRRAALKLHRSFAGESRPAGERAVREHALLARLSAELPGPGPGDATPSVPRPLGLAAGAGAVLMELCRGERLDRTIRRGRTAVPGSAAAARLASSVRAAGTWLTALQATALPAAGAEEDPRTRLERRTHEDLAALAATGVLPARRLAALERRLGSLLAGVGTGGVVPRHGDFWPGNVFVSPGRVEVVDFEALEAGFAWEDPARFLLHLELTFAYPFLARRGRRLARAFRAGLGRPEAVDPAGLALGRFVSLLAMLRHAPQPRGRLARWQRRRVVRRLERA